MNINKEITKEFNDVYGEENIEIEFKKNEEFKEKQYYFQYDFKIKIDKFKKIFLIKDFSIEKYKEIVINSKNQNIIFHKENGSQERKYKYFNSWMPKFLQNLKKENQDYDFFCLIYVNTMKINFEKNIIKNLFLCNYLSLKKLIEKIKIQNMLNT